MSVFVVVVIVSCFISFFNCLCFSPFADNLVCIRRTPKAVVVVFLLLFPQFMLLLTDFFYSLLY